MKFNCYLEHDKEKTINGLVYSESWLEYIDTIVVIDKKINAGDIIDFEGIKYVVCKIETSFSRYGSTGNIYLKELVTKE